MIHFKEPDLNNLSSDEYIFKDTKYEGMNVKNGTVQDVDAVTGATFTSKAMQENIRRAVDYYKKHK